ncbi:hypothetical protein LBMAG42_20280 [Deltaproteobacteria bacterium]|nr:hypothetical protein LBMAG42_20280 [Deltaproteobacteria bacterium]
MSRAVASGLLLRWGLSASLLAGAAPAFSAEPVREPLVDRRVDVAFGLASQWGLGGTTVAWETALAQRFEFSGEIGRRQRTSVGFALVHSRPEVADAGGLVAGAPAASISGWRDELSVLFTIRVPLQVGAALPALQPVVRFLPSFGFSGGAFITDAHLALPSFDAFVPLRARAVTPAFGARFGVECRFYSWLSLLPHAELLVTVGPNRREQTGGETYDAEGRMLVGADAVVRF